MKRHLLTLALLPLAACTLPVGPSRYSFQDARGEPSDAASAACVIDAGSGLSWERKTASGLRAADHHYLPAPPATPLNPPACGGHTPGCRSADYVAAVNHSNLCGYADWRVPSERELETLRISTMPATIPSIDAKAFPDQRTGFYWTRSLRRVDGVLAVAFDAEHHIQPGISLARGDHAHLRLVRGPRLDDPPPPHIPRRRRFIPLVHKGSAAGPGEITACVDDTQGAAPLSTESLWHLNGPQPLEEVGTVEQQLRQTGACGVHGWRIPTPDEARDLFRGASPGSTAELQTALPGLRPDRPVWVRHADGRLTPACAQACAEAAGPPDLLLYAPVARPTLARPKPAPEQDLPATELARLRAAYARYLPGAARQPHWPAPTLDASMEDGFVDLGLLPPVPFPPDNPYSAAKVALGQRLFFDTVLSRNQKIACSHCHQPTTGWTDRRSVSPGHVGQLGTRNSMSILNTAYVKDLFWDGRAASLEEQVGGPIANPLEMHTTPAEVVARLATRDDYTPLFQAAFGSHEVTLTRIAQAIATFERTLISRESDFDRFLKGHHQALSDNALWGLHLFRTKARCINCHNTPLFSDNRFHSNGLHFYGRELEDLGRFEVTGRPEDKGRFRTPGLRDVMHTGNYMHNGRFPLTEGQGVIAMYDAGMVQFGPTGPAKYQPDLPVTSPEVRPLGLNARERKALFAFLKAISAEPRQEPASEEELGLRAGLQ